MIKAEQVGDNSGRDARDWSGKKLFHDPLKRELGSEKNSREIELRWKQSLKVK